MYKQGDILLIRIPYSDLSSSKQRPVMVISNDIYNSEFADIIVMAITSNQIHAEEYSVLITNQDMDIGNLKIDSCLRADKIYTLSQHIVVSRFGRVKADIIAKAKEKLSNYL